MGPKRGFDFEDLDTRRGRKKAKENRERQERVAQTAQELHQRNGHLHQVSGSSTIGYSMDTKGVPLKFRNASALKTQPSKEHVKLRDDVPSQPVKKQVSIGLACDNVLTST